MKIASRLVAAFVLPMLALRAVPTQADSPVNVAGFAHVRTVGGIQEYALERNGLQVLLLPDHSAPVLTFMVTYRVGSRNEVTGTTGATHLLEHLMFKGTPTHNREMGTSLDQFLESVGAISNATTWLDRTNYFANLGSEHLEKVVELEADRMRNLRLREEDRRPEMTVVRNEFEIGENDPLRVLDREITAAAYVAHPYHHSTIGWRSDIENVPIEKLREFYNTFYWPDNATVTIVGDFQPATALALIDKYYGTYPRAPKPIPVVYTVEPAQTGPRRVVCKLAGQLGIVGIGYKIPSGRDPDAAALAVLSAILTSGKSSRFYRALTDRNLTMNVQGDAGMFHDPSLISLYASLAPGATHDQVEKIMVSEIETLKKSGVTGTEVSGAVNQLLAASAFARDGSFAIASAINEFIAAGDWTLFVTIDDALRKVTPDDIRRVANRYLQEDQSTTGWFVPTVADATHE
ncbi:MAG: insulinase family protein [Opitutaceae bacterium]|nr:insulinase family protein [Opitutaceae bacterium]